MFPDPDKKVEVMTSREVLGIFFPDHRWHNVATVETSTICTIECSCGAKLQISLRERLDSGYALSVLYKALQKAPQHKTS